MNSASGASKPGLWSWELCSAAALYSATGDYECQRKGGNKAAGQRYDRRVVHLRLFIRNIWALLSAVIFALYVRILPLVVLIGGVGYTWKNMVLMLKCLVAAWQDADGPSNCAGDLSLACRRHPAYETLHRRDHIFFPRQYQRIWL